MVTPDAWHGAVHTPRAVLRRSVAAPVAVIRRLVALGLIVFAAGCAAHNAGLPVPAVKKMKATVRLPPPKVAVRHSRARPRRPARTEHDRQTEKVASIDPNTLIGLAPSAVERLLGAPDNISKGSPSLIWTYAGLGCSFRIFFYPDIKTASFHALKYGSVGAHDEPMDRTRACIRTILREKNNEPG